MENNCIKYAISQQRESGCGTFTLFWISRAFSFVKKVNKPSKILLDFYFLNYMVVENYGAKVCLPNVHEPYKEETSFCKGIRKSSYL